MARALADGWLRSPRLNMPGPSPPARSPRRTRVEQAAFYEHLVETSLHLFSNGGVDALTMRGLASEVGIPPMSLYRYFPTKTHLVQHVWDDILGRAGEHSQGRAGAAVEPLDRLRNCLDGFLEYWLENPEHYWVVFSIRPGSNGHNGDAGGEVLGPNPQRFVQLLADCFDECVPQMSLPAEERQRLMDLLLCKVLGFMLGTIGLASLGWQDVNGLKERLLDDMVDQVRLAQAR